MEIASIYPFARGQQKLLIWVQARVSVDHDRLLTVGAWAIQVAERYPKAQVVGLDLAPVQFVSELPNCEFVTADFTEDLDELFDEASIDLIQAR